MRSQSAQHSSCEGLVTAQVLKMPKHHAYSLSHSLANILFPLQVTGRLGRTQMDSIMRWMQVGHNRTPSDPSNVDDFVSPTAIDRRLIYRSGRLFFCVESVDMTVTVTHVNYKYRLLVRLPLHHAPHCR